MSNPIKYSTGLETLALKKGNFYVGTNDVGKGPTSSTGYFDGVSPASGGYVIYVRNSAGRNLIYGAPNDSQLILITNRIAGTSYTTVNECLVYFAGQTDKIVLNRDYEPIVTDGLVLNLDAGFTPSYSRSGTTWYDVSTNSINGTLTNGPTFNSGDGGNISFDGTDDFVNLGNNSILNYTTLSFSFNVWFKINNLNPPQNSGQGNFIFSRGQFRENGYYFQINSSGGARFITNQSGAAQVSGANSGTININTWYNVCFSMNGSVLTTYVNGVDASGESDPHINPTSTTRNFVIGRYDTVNWYLNGNMAVLMSYNRPLSAAEALQNFNAQKSRFGL